MDEKLMSDLFARLDALTAKLGVAGEYAWFLLVRKAWWDAFSMLLAHVIPMFLCLVVYICGEWKRESFEGDPTPRTVARVIACCVFSLTVLVFCLNVGSGNFLGLFSPESAALQYLLYLLKG